MKLGPDYAPSLDPNLNPHGPSTSLPPSSCFVFLFLLSLNCREFARINLRERIRDQFVIAQGPLRSFAADTRFFLGSFVEGIIKNVQVSGRLYNPTCSGCVVNARSTCI